jgi:hypothetical protein
MKFIKGIGIMLLVVSGGLQAGEKKSELTSKGLLTSANAVKGLVLVASAYYLFPNNPGAVALNSNFPAAGTLLGRANLANSPDKTATGLGKLVTHMFNASRVVITAAGSLKVLDFCAKGVNAGVGKEIIPAIPQVF